MPRGAPDFFSVIDIRAQTLAQLLNRPVYGSARVCSSDGWVTVPAASAKILCNISGTGMIYGGSAWARGVEGTTALHNYDWFVFIIDDEPMGAYVFRDLNVWELKKAMGLAPYLARYDTAANCYSVIIPYGFTFEFSFQLEYVNKATEDAEVIYKVYYALI